MHTHWECLLQPRPCSCCSGRCRMISKWLPRSTVITHTDRFCNFKVKPPYSKTLVNRSANVNLIISQKSKFCCDLQEWYFSADLAGSIQTPHFLSPPSLPSPTSFFCDISSSKQRLCDITKCSVMRFMTRTDCDELRWDGHRQLGVEERVELLRGN